MKLPRLRAADGEPPLRTALLETVETQRFGCEMAGSPLYSTVLEAVAHDVETGGGCWSLLEPYAASPFGDAVVLRLLAGVHRIVLDGRATELAAHYPSVGGAVGADAADAFLEVIGRHQEELALAMTRGVQTNEVGRTAALLCGYLELARSGLPLRILEVGASAGLNLWFDHYRYLSPGWSFGPPDSPLCFEGPFFGRPPVLVDALRVRERSGCDLDPIDPTSEEGRVRLRSFVWPDQLDRLARLDGALAVASTRPPVVERADAVDWLTEKLAQPVGGCTTVVVHSIVFQYLPDDSKRRFVEVAEAAGGAATAEAPVAWLRMEPGGDQAEVRLTTWPGGATRLLARSSYHGPPVVLTA